MRVDARSLVETLCAGNYEPDDDQCDGENMLREKRYFQTNPRAAQIRKNAGDT